MTNDEIPKGWRRINDVCIGTGGGPDASSRDRPEYSVFHHGDRARGSGKHGTAERSSPKVSPIATQRSTPADSTTEIERLRAEALRPQTVRVTSRMRATAVRLADISEREKRRADLYAAMVSCLIAGGKR